MLDADALDEARNLLHGWLRAEGIDPLADIEQDEPVEYATAAAAPAFDRSSESLQKPSHSPPSAAAVRRANRHEAARSQQQARIAAELRAKQTAAALRADRYNQSHQILDRQRHSNFVRVKSANSNEVQHIDDQQTQRLQQQAAHEAAVQRQQLAKFAARRQHWLLAKVFVVWHKRAAAQATLRFRRLVHFREAARRRTLQRCVAQWQYCQRATAQLVSDVAERRAWRSKRYVFMQLKALVRQAKMAAVTKSLHLRLRTLSRIMRGWSAYARDSSLHRAHLAYQVLFI